MPVTADILATWRGPGTVMRRHLAQGLSEPRILAWAMGGCALLFVANLPALARKAHLDGVALDMLMGGALLSIIFFLPLILYALALLVAGVARVVGRPVGGAASRAALFWALLAASPLVLLNGLVAGLIGPGPALTLVGALWFAAFLWFWLAGLRAAAQVQG